MDITALVQGIGLLQNVVGTLKQAKDLLPEGKKKDEAERALATAERELKVAEGKIASELDYELCRSHFPPEIMLSEDDRIWKCPECGNQKDTGPSIGYLEIA